MDTNTKNVFGQPRLRASLRDLRSPRKNYKSTIEDDLKKLIIMDNLTPEQERDAGVRSRPCGRAREDGPPRCHCSLFLPGLRPSARQPRLDGCGFVTGSQDVTV